jgi:uncharacterized protein involved in exopolysaccharide biosynthesis
MEADIVDKMAVNRNEAEKARARISEEIEDVRGRLEDHEAKHERAEANLRLHDKSIDEVRQEMME